MSVEEEIDRLCQNIIWTQPAENTDTGAVVWECNTGLPQYFGSSFSFDGKRALGWIFSVFRSQKEPVSQVPGQPRTSRGSKICFAFALGAFQQQSHNGL